MQAPSTTRARNSTIDAASDLRMARAGRAMIGMFAAVVFGAALIGILNRVTKGAAVAHETIPMRMGSLTVHGPLKVRGDLAVSGEMVVHGPVRAQRIDRVPPSTLQVREKIGPRTIDGPMKVEQSLIVDGDLRVDGPLSVTGEIKATTEIAADGRINQRSAL